MHRMNGPFLIVSLNRADWLTLGGLLLSGLGLLAALRGTLSLAIVLMLLAMLVDMLDGVLARRLGLESEFGRHLDSLCDVLTYLILPLFLLYQFGMQDVLALAALLAFLTAGLLRLARFNILPTVEENGVRYHIGLQVIWSQLVVVLAFPAWRWYGDAARLAFIPILLCMSLLMIRNMRVRKPTHYPILASLILAVAAVYAWLHLSGVRAP
jgi:CDP-diacylglycerol--serine O-phosphatidyltransferase